MLWLFPMLNIFLRAGLIHSEVCGWLIDTVQFSFLVPAHRHYLGILKDQLMDEISSSDILEFMLKITVGCNGKVDDKLMQSLILQGMTPMVRLYVEIGNELPTTYEFNLRGLLVPINGKSESSCNETSCPSVWLVPFPVEKSSTRVRVRITTGGVGYQEYYTDTFLDVAYLFKNNFEMNLKAIPTQDAIKTLIEMSPLYVDVNKENEMSIAISLLPKHPMVLVSTSDFRKYFFTKIIPNQGNFGRVCSNPEQNINSVMMLSSVTLVATKFGLIAQKVSDFHLVSSMCVSQMSTRYDNQSQVVLIVSNHEDARDKCGAVAVAYISSNESSWPTFTELVDEGGSNSNIHRYCQVTLSFECCLVSSVISRMAHRFYFLVLNERKDKYFIIELNRFNKSWSKVCSTDANVRLTKLLVHDTISEGIIYAYGSALLICQGNNQKLTSIANGTTEIIQLTTLYDNYYFFITREKEIGIGEINFDRTLYLSMLWSNPPLSLKDAVAIFKSSSRVLTLVKYFNDSENNEIAFKTEDLNTQTYIEQFHYNMNLRLRRGIPACTIESLNIDIQEITKLCGVKSYQLVPAENNEGTIYNSKQAIFLYQGVTSFVVAHAMNPEASESGYHTKFRDVISKWQYNQNAIEFSSLEKLKDKILQRPAYELLANNYKREYDEEYEIDFGFPPIVYIDRGEVFTTYVTFHYTNKHNFSRESVIVKASSSELKTFSKTVNISETDRIRVYEIKISGGLDRHIRQPPGVNLVSTLVEFRFVDDNEQTCVQGAIEPEGKYKVRVLLGCPPSKRLVFDWQKTVARNKFLFDDNYDCLRPIPNKPCFSFYGEFSPVFTIVDDVAGTQKIYTDELLFLVVGGGAVGEKIRLFSQKEIIDYNYLNGTEHHAIWRPSHHYHEDHNEDAEHNEHHREGTQNSPQQRSVVKRQRKWVETTHLANDHVPLIHYGGKAIHWMCEWHSPCGNVDPNFPEDSQYDLLIEISNRNLESMFTDCEFTQRFTIRIHGLPASLIHKALPQLAIAVAFILTFFIFYHCFRIYRNKLNEELRPVT